MSLQVSLPQALLSCGAMTLAYVGSLYLWSSSVRKSRNEPEVILRRSMSAVAVCLVSPLLVVATTVVDAPSFFELLGLRTTGVVAAVVVPVGVTAILFAAPLVLVLRDQEEGLHVQVSWVNLRNLVVGPITEEIVFRACMLPLLLGAGVQPLVAILSCPLFFGLAHFHHLWEHVKKAGLPMSRGILLVLQQLAYTTLFGVYEGFLLYRTGHLVSIILVHSFCNALGLPDFGRILRDRTLLVVQLLGIIGFAVLVGPLTHPALYGTK